ncbi:lecithin retinol acyltransferase family protein [Streptomyces sp. NPDC046977]|uniref:lecithin retinol acyltransferase family protein n=1 Tax=Streptomyces sp. NPDC046977 TaxID=3154703 RepID=UPI0033DE6D8A
MAAGDHLVVTRPDGWIAAGRRHHGIDMGDGTVAHLTGFSKRSAKAIRTNLRVFAQSGDPQVVDYDWIARNPPHFAAGRKRRRGAPPIHPLPVQEVLSRALHGLDMGGYNAAARNCEHWATLVKTGVSFSYEVEERAYNPLPEFAVALLWEVLRGTNPHDTAGNYLGSVYEHGGAHYREQYAEPGAIPPSWSRSVDGRASWQPVAQRDVPHPLREVAVARR